MKQKKVVRSIGIDRIEETDAQPRKYFDTAKLMDLSESIRENGVLQPIFVRKNGAKYALVAGGRRLRAAGAAGLSSVPAIVLSADGNEARVVALLENMHREELGVFEQAAAIKELLAQKGMTQKTVAQKLSISQGAVANKLRLLAFDEQQRAYALEWGLGERHLRAVLRLPDERRDVAIEEIGRAKMSAATAEKYVQKIIDSEPEGVRRHAVIKDVRVFFNTITRAVEVMNRAGLGAVAVRRDTPEFIEYTVRIPAGAERNSSA